MRNTGIVTALFVAVIPVAACYHATIETGATPSAQVIQQDFASGWIYGLIPPSTLATAAKCPNGVAKVETQLSFVNQLVSAITFGIYTPMSIKVTCAAGKTAMVEGTHSDFAVGLSAGADSIRDTFVKAADQAVKENKPVLVEVHQ